MDDEDFTFETAPFPPEPLPEGKIFNKTIQTIVNCIVSLPTDPASPFVTLAASLPNPSSSSSTPQQQDTNTSSNNADMNNKAIVACVDPQTGLAIIPCMQEKEVEHAREVLRLYPAFAEVRRRIVPRLVNDEKFWQAYFCLLAIQTRFETRMEAAFGAEREDGMDDDNTADSKHSAVEIQSTMSARVVLRMPTATTTTTRHSNNLAPNKNKTSTDQQQQQQSSSLEPDSPTTRIIPGKRLRIPPSLCITVKDSNIDSTLVGGGSASGLGGGGGGGNNGASLGIGRACTSTMLMGKDLMTKHLRDEWRRNLNEMCDY